VGAQLSERVFEWLDATVPAQGTLAIGYSGGGDSHALLCLITPWCRARHRALVAVTVDHGLRPESRQDAARAAGMARRLGVGSKILTWEGLKPTTGVQAAARRARHALLAGYCAEHEIRALLLGHTRDDQAETVWMRMQAGGGWRACGGMAPVAPSPLWPEGRALSLFRPVLAESRADLRAMLVERGEAWIEDPSNENRDFTRVAVRQRLAGLAEVGFDPQRLSAWSESLREQRREERAEAAEIIRLAVSLTDWGGAELDLGRLQRLSDARLARVLEPLALALSGQGAPARSGAVAALVDAVQSGQARTGGGVHVFQQGGSGWMIRDVGALTGRVDRPGLKSVALTARSAHVWDGRYEIETSMEDISAGPLGSEYSGLNDIDVLQRVPGPARSGLLAIRCVDRVVALAGLKSDPAVKLSPLMARRLDQRLFPGTPDAWTDTPSKKVELSR
jgi:tRNA(Ile)-lysidine synthase